MSRWVALKIRLDRERHVVVARASSESVSGDGCGTGFPPVALPEPPPSSLLEFFGCTRWRWSARKTEGQNRDEITLLGSQER